MAKSCPQNELCPAIFINLQPPPADCKSLSASGEPDVLYPVYSNHHSEPGRESEKGTYFEVHCQGHSTRIQKPGNSTLGKDSRSLPARFTSHHGRLFLIVLWRGFPSCLKLCPPTQGRFCWTPGAAMASSLFSIMSRETFEKNFYFPLSLPVTIPNRLLRVGWWLSYFPLQASHCYSLIVSKYPQGICVNDILSFWFFISSEHALNSFWVSNVHLSWWNTNQWSHLDKKLWLAQEAILFHCFI